MATISAVSLVCLYASGVVTGCLLALTHASAFYTVIAAAFVGCCGGISFMGFTRSTPVTQPVTPPVTQPVTQPVVDMITLYAYGAATKYHSDGECTKRGRIPQVLAVPRVVVSAMRRERFCGHCCAGLGT